MGFFSLAKSSTRTRSPESTSPVTIFKPLWPRTKPIERTRSVKLSVCFEQRFNPVALEVACGRASHTDRTSTDTNPDIAPLLDARSPLELLAQMTTAEGRRHRPTRYNSVPAPPLACADGPLTSAFAPDNETFVRSASDDICEMYTRTRDGAFEPTPVVRGSPSNVVPSIFAVPNSPSFAVSCVLPSYDTWVAGLTSMKFATEVFSLISLETAKNTPGIRYRPEGFEMA